MRAMSLFRYIVIVGAVCALTACNNTTEPATERQTVTLRFTRFEVQREDMSRAVKDVSEYVTHLDVWIINAGDTICLHQSSTDDGFGTVSVSLDKTLTYTLYAVAHKANGPATLKDGVISFPEDKVTHTFFVRKEFHPSETIVCPMKRIVAQLLFSTVDAIPDNVTQMRFTISDVFNQWNVAGYGVNMLDRISTINLSSKHDDGSATFAVYAITSDEDTPHDILVEALSSDGRVVKSHTITGLVMRNGQRNNVSGVFFNDNIGSALRFTADDWQDGGYYNY